MRGKSGRPGPAIKGDPGARGRDGAEIVGLYRDGDEIGKQLFISKLTVDSHRKKLLNKTGCSNTALLTSLAVKKGWI